MNLALSIAAPSALAGGEAIGGLSCARAPETISALTAAESILASKRVCSSRKRGLPPLLTTLEREACSASMEPARIRERASTAAQHASSLEAPNAKQR